MESLNMQMPLARMTIDNDILTLDILGVMKQFTLKTKEVGDRIKEGFPMVEELIESCRFVYEKEAVSDSMLASINQDATWVKYTKDHLIKVQQFDGEITYLDVCTIIVKHIINNTITATFEKFVDVVDYLSSLVKYVESEYDKSYESNLAVVSDVALYTALTDLSFDVTATEEDNSVVHKFTGLACTATYVDNWATVEKNLELLRPYMDKLAALGNTAPERSIVKETVDCIPTIVMHATVIRICSPKDIIAKPWNLAVMRGYLRLIRHPTEGIRKAIQLIQSGTDDNEQLSIFLTIVLQEWIFTETIESPNLTTTTH